MKNLLPVSELYNNKGFCPTNLMLQVLDAFLACDEQQSPTKILVGLGHERSNWYQWISKSGFNDWWTKAVDKRIAELDLAEVKRSLFLRAKQGDVQAAKILLERYDREYKPTQKHEIEAFAGKRPPDNENVNDAVERSKARIAQCRKDREN